MPCVYYPSCSSYCAPVFLQPSNHLKIAILAENAGETMLKARYSIT